MKKRKKENSTYKAWRKIRGDWGNISPITKVIPNKKKPRRHPKHKGQSRDWLF